MVHSESSERKKRKPRGRPFTSDNNPKKLKREVLDDPGLESSDEGGIVATLEQGSAVEALKEAYDVGMKQHEENIKEMLNPSIEPIQEVPKEGEVIDCIEFKNGSNVLKIVFKKQHNRSFRIQAFLNESTEIRPVTYTGSHTATTFWNLLKGSLKKD